MVLAECGSTCLLIQIQSLENWEAETHEFSWNKKKPRAGEMVQRFRAFALAEDQDSVPGTHTVTHNHPCFQFRASKALFSPLQAPGTQVVQIHTCRQNAHTHKVNKSKIQGQRDGSVLRAQSTVCSSRGLGSIPSTCLSAHNHL